MARIVVAGGSGVLGTLVCGEVGRLLPEAEVIVAARGVERARQTAESLTGRGVAAKVTQLDGADRDSIRRALRGADAVVVAMGQRAPHIQSVCVERGIPCVDVTASADLTRAVRALDELARLAGVASIAMAGLFPGLSGLLARRAAARLDQVTRVDVALVQHTNGNVGHSGIVDMVEIIAAPVDHHGQVGPGFRRRWPELRQLRLIDHAERRALDTEAELPHTAYWTGWNSAPFTAMVALLVRARLLPRLAPRLATLVRHDPTQPEPVELHVLAHGTRGGEETRVGLRLSAASDYGATATVAAALTALCLEDRLAGAGTPLSFVSAEALLARMRSDTVTLHA